MAKHGRRIAEGLSTWPYAVVLAVTGAAAETLGLGGMPAKTLEIENILFIVLLLTFIATALIKFVKRS
jgi:hypothetical protein